MRARFTLPLLLLALPLLAPSYPTQTTYKLRLVPGDSTKYREESSQKSEMAMSGANDMSSKTSVKTSQIYEFGKAADGWTPVTVKTENFDMSSDAPAGPGFDPDALAKQMKSLVISGSVDGHGLIKDLKMDGLDEGSPAAIIAGASKAALEHIGLSGLNFPDKDLKPGDSWSKDLDLAEMVKAGSNGMVDAEPTKVPYTITFVGPEKLDAVDAYHLTVEMKGSMPISVAAAGMKGTTTVLTKGDFYVDASTGMMIKQSVKNTSHSDLGQIVVDQTTTSEGTMKKL